MAIQFEAPIGYGFDIAALFGVPASLIDEAKMSGVGIAPKANNPLEFVVSKGAVPVGVVSVKGTALTMAKAKKLGPASKEVIAGQFIQAIKGAMKTDMDLTSPYHEAMKLVKPKATPKPTQSVVGSASPPESGTTTYHQPSTTPPPTATKVPLCDAKALGQPVHGSSNGSTYYTVAMFKGMNMAIRAKFNRLSVRVEGPALNSYGDTLKGLGFKVKADYASVHFDLASDTLIAKTVGAIVSTLGFDKLLGAINADSLKDK